MNTKKLGRTPGLSKLPTIAVKQDRLLSFVKDSKANFQSATGGLVRVGNWFYVIADDEHYLGAWSLDDDKKARVVSAFVGNVPSLVAGLERFKPSLVALIRLSGAGAARTSWISYYGGEGPSQYLLGVPSGLAGAANRGCLLGLGAHGEIITGPMSIDFEPLYSKLTEYVSELTIEGATVCGRNLYLFHRGKERKSIVRLSLRNLAYELVTMRSVGGGHLRGVTDYEWNSSDGGEFDFVGAASVSDDLYFVATESTPVTHNVLGKIDRFGSVKYLGRLDCDCQVGGLSAELLGKKLKLWFLTGEAKEPAGLRLLTSEIDYHA